MSNLDQICLGLISLGVGFTLKIFLETGRVVDALHREGMSCLNALAGCQKAILQEEDRVRILEASVAELEKEIAGLDGEEKRLRDKIEGVRKKLERTNKARIKAEA